MPNVNRSRVIDTSVSRIWDLVSDPYNMPRWFPRCVRVEDVGGAPGQKRARWTAVMETEKGSTVRADYRCTGATAEERYVWEQDLVGSPFERILASWAMQIELAPAGEEGSAKVTVRSMQKLRGFSRLGSPMMRTGSGRNLDAALDGIEEALT